MLDFNFPPSAQSELFSLLNHDQQQAVRPVLRLVKRPYQTQLCTSLIDYLEGNGQQELHEPVLNLMQQSIIEACHLKPLR